MRDKLRQRFGGKKYSTTHQPMKSKFHGTVENKLSEQERKQINQQVSEGKLPF